MHAVFSAYFQSFLHPFEVQESLRRLRMNRAQKAELLPFRLVVGQNAPAEKAAAPEEMNFFEVLCVSWLMAMIQAAWVCIAICVGWLWFRDSFADSYAFSLLEGTLFKQQQGILLVLLFKVVLFPLNFWAMAQVWPYCLRLFGRLIGRKDGLEEGSKQVVNHALSAHAFLLVPIFGSGLFAIAFLIYLYAGLTRNLEWPPLQAGAALLAPLFLLFLLILCFLLSLVFFFSSLVF